MTDDGRKVTSPSSQVPIHVVFGSATYRPIGHLPRENSIEEEKVAAMLRRSLAERGYLPADDAHPATLGLVYYWGPHAVMDMSAATQEQVLRNFLDRAALVAGDKFASDLASAFRESARIAEATAPSPGGGRLSAATTMATASSMADPVVLFRRRHPLNDTLVDHAATSCYYLVVSAYEYKSLATPQKKLLWRTRATVNSQGVSQSQVFPTLISIAGHFLGKEMAKPEITRFRANEPLVEFDPTGK